MHLPATATGFDAASGPSASCSNMLHIVTQEAQGQKSDELLFGLDRGGAMFFLAPAPAAITCAMALALALV